MWMEINSYSCRFHLQTAIVAETPTTRLKAATNSLTRAVYILMSIENLFLVPVLLEDAPVGLGLGAKAAFCLVCNRNTLPDLGLFPSPGSEGSVASTCGCSL